MGSSDESASTGWVRGILRVARRWLVRALILGLAFGAGLLAARVPDAYRSLFVSRTVDLGPETRRQAAEDLYGQTVTSTRATVNLLGDHYLTVAATGSAERRESALERLVELQDLGAAPLRDAFRADEPRRRGAAVEVLRRARELRSIPDEILIPHLVRRIARHEVDVYLPAYRDLRDLGSAALPALREAAEAPANLLQRVTAATLLALERDKEGIGHLIDLLAVRETVGLSEDRLDLPAARVAAEKLRYVTGRNLELPDDPTAREALVASWRSWWAENRSTFRFAHAPIVR